MKLYGTKVWITEEVEHTEGGIIRELLMKELVGGVVMHG